MKRSKITENKIRSRVGERSFGRGKRYYEQGAIMNPWLQGDTLKTKCFGSMPQPYHIWVKLGPEGIEFGECSCPIRGGGHCKHVAALLKRPLKTVPNLTKGKVSISKKAIAWSPLSLFRLRV